MSKIVSSPDMSVLDFSVRLDLSTATPTVRVSNLSTISNAGNLDWAFDLISPYGTPIHIGDIENPDVSGAFTNFDFPEELPEPFGQVEFNLSKGYSVTARVKDSANNVFFLEKEKGICKPNGNTPKNNFGAADVSIEAKCNQAQLYVTDKTNVLYKSLTGTRISSTTKITYPTDENGNTPAPITVTTMPSLFPLKVSGDGHNIYVAYVYEYDLGDNFFVRIRYSFNQTFPVWCNVDLCPLFSEVEKLTEYVSKDCSEGSEKREKTTKLQLINSKLLKAITGIIQPLCGWDVPKIIEEIKAIGGFTCECCRPQGIHAGSVLVADANFTVNKVCGDMLLSWEIDGSGNIQLNYQDKSYVFIMSDAENNTAAVTLTTTETNCVKTTKLFVDKALLAGEVLTEIQNNPTLITILNSLIENTQLTCSGLTGTEILDIDNCDYTVAIPIGSSPVTINSILIAGIVYVAPGELLATNASGVESWLNGLAHGTFTAVYSSVANTLTITTVANPYAVTSIGLSNNVVTGSLYSQKFSGNCGLICRILQAIITYLNGLKLMNVQVGGTIKVCNLVKGQVVEQIFGPTDNSFDLIEALSASVCNLVSNLLNGKLDGVVIKNSFAEYSNGLMDGADYALVFFNGVPTKMPLKNLAMAIFQLLGTDVDVKSIYCAQSKCISVGNCNSVTGLTIAPGGTTAGVSWNPSVGATGYKYSIDGANWFTVVGTAAAVTGLTASTAYTFRIYPIYSSGDGIDCLITLGFSTIAVGTGCIAPTGFIVDNIGTTEARLTWNAVTGASGYQYRLNSGSWNNVGLVLTTDIVGLTPDETYAVDVRAIIGGTPCTEMSSDTFDTLVEGEFVINNNDDNAIITAVGGGFYTLIYGVLPVNPAQIARGTHSTYSGVVTVTLTTGTADLLIYRNGVLHDNISGIIGVNSFDTISFLDTDNIVIVAQVPA